MSIKWGNCVIKKAEESRRNLEKEQTPGQEKKERKKNTPPSLVEEMLVTMVDSEICFWHLQSHNPAFLFAVQEGLTLEKLTLKQYCYPINMDKCWLFNF